jgi:hypothetical protein
MSTTVLDSLRLSIEHLSMLLAARLEADPFRTFLELVAVFLASIVGFSWLMITWLSSGGKEEKSGKKKE